MSTSVLDWYRRYLDALRGCQGHRPLAERLGSLVPRPRLRENRTAQALTLTLAAPIGEPCSRFLPPEAG